MQKIKWCLSSLNFLATKGDLKLRLSKKFIITKVFEKNRELREFYILRLKLLAFLQVYFIEFFMIID